MMILKQKEFGIFQGKHLVLVNQCNFRIFEISLNRTAILKLYSIDFDIKYSEQGFISYIRLMPKTLLYFLKLRVSLRTDHQLANEDAKLVAEKIDKWKKQSDIHIQSIYFNLHMEIKTRKCTIQYNLPFQIEGQIRQNSPNRLMSLNQNESQQHSNNIDTDQFVTEKALPSLRLLTNALVKNRQERRAASSTQQRSIKIQDFVSQTGSNVGGIGPQIYSQQQSKILNTPNQLNFFFSNFNFIRYKLLYRASDCDFSVKEFHQRCDGVKNTIVVCQSESNYVFGGFTPLTWNEDFTKKKSFFKSDNQNKTFLFSLNLLQKYQLIKQKRNKAICAFQGMGPTFGGGYDLQIMNKTNILQNTTSYFPSNFSKLDGKNPKRQAIFGTKRRCFKLKQYEVFSVLFLNASDTLRTKNAKQLRTHLKKII